MIHTSFEFEARNEQSTKDKKAPAKRRRRQPQKSEPAESEVIKQLRATISILRNYVRVTNELSAESDARHSRLIAKVCDLESQNQFLQIHISLMADGHSSIPADMLPRLIRLCHPDRHNNSEASNQATRWLLEQRKKQ